MADHRVQGRGPVLVPVLAAVAVVAGLLTVLPGGPASLLAPSGPGVDEDFLAAYRRSRTEELVVVSDFTRTFNDGRQLAYEQQVVQRPPDDVLLIGAGTASGRIGGRIVRCNVGPSGAVDCIQSVAAPPYDEVVDGEVEAMAGLVDRAYAVERQGPDCYVLRLEIDLPSPPYGGAARFCFDAGSGAVRSLEVRRAEAVDLLEAVEVRTEVVAADLRPDSLGEPIASGG